MYYVFLDIDGVLTSARAEMSDGIPRTWMKFDPIAIDFFNRIHDNHDVEFVLSSTWRNYITDAMSLHWIESCFVSAGFRGKLAKEWKVNIQEDHDLYRKQRAWEIKDYLDRHDHDDFMIFDDNDYLFNEVLGKRRFIQTDHANGLMVNHMKSALSIAGNWSKR